MPLAALVLAWVQAADLRAHLFRDGEARGVVAGAGDPAARRELFHALVQSEVVQLELPIGEDRAHVVIDDHLSSLSSKLHGHPCPRFLPRHRRGSLEVAPVPGIPFFSDFSLPTFQAGR